MQTRYMERSSSMAAKGKRALDPSGSSEAQTEPKRPALASVILEALKADSLQRLCLSLEPILRRVVSEEVERSLAKLGPPRISRRVSPKLIKGPHGRSLQLHFRSKLSLPLFTGAKIEGEQGAAIHVVLIDANTGHVVASGPESSAKLEVVVLEGDFNKDDDDVWTQEEFEAHIVKEREGKGPLLIGNLQVMLKEGMGTVGELTFTDNSSWIRSRMFRLGLKVASGFCGGIHVQEAKTDAFTVKDHRGELYKKHYPPSLTDKVWRLEKIRKDGSFHKRLNKSGIYTVEDFLRLVVKDSPKLRKILGSGMSNKMWDVLVDHAKTCVLNQKLYVYYPDDSRDVGVVFNNICALSGLIAGGQFCSAVSLSDTQKVFVDNLVKKAYENWAHIVEYDGKALLDSWQSVDFDVHQLHYAATQQNYPNSFDNRHSLPSLTASVPSESPPAMPSSTIGGYNGNLGTRYASNAQNTIVAAPTDLDGSSFALQNQLFNPFQQARPHSSNNFLALGPTPPPTSAFVPGATPDLYSSLSGHEDHFPEEEIRLRSQEMLENEDLQHLLSFFNAGGPGPGLGPGCYMEDGLLHSSVCGPIPLSNCNYGVDEDRARSSGKAVVGWRKLKAALRWGIFIRKQAAERRAQIVELG